MWPGSDKKGEKTNVIHFYTKKVRLEAGCVYTRQKWSTVKTGQHRYQFHKGYTNTFCCRVL